MPLLLSLPVVGHSYQVSSYKTPDLTTTARCTAGDIAARVAAARASCTEWAAATERPSGGR